MSQEKMDINTHIKALGQKYMGIRPALHREEMFRDTSLHAEKGDGHPIPVTNFLNAQCTYLNL
jgi:saccharopepsin